jgi:hypothetical protein
MTNESFKGVGGLRVARRARAQGVTLDGQAFLA